MTDHRPGDDDTPLPSSMSGSADATSWPDPPPPYPDPLQAPPTAPFPTAPLPTAPPPMSPFPVAQSTQAPYGGYAPPHGGYAPPHGDYAPAYAYGPQQPAQQTSGLAIASLIVSCVAVAALCGSLVGGLLGFVGAGLGHVARHRMRRTGEGGGQLALAGIIIGWVCAAVAIVAVAGIGLLLVNGSFGP